MSFNFGPMEQRRWVAYYDLAGGRNTKKDPHALDRNQLSVSDNTWQAQGNTLGKRPGNISLLGISSMPGTAVPGGTGLGVSLIAMAEGRFFEQTTLVVQGANNKLAAVPLALPAISTNVNQWASIGSVSGGRIRAAQLFDPSPPNPNGPDGTLFIVTGKDVPQAWIGPGNVMKPLTYLNPNFLPTKSDGTGRPITPSLVATLFSSLFYSGDDSDPSMVYISNPFAPELFTSNLVVPTTTITGGSYIGLPVGRGDGINGGNVSGMAPLGPAMIIYKHSAIYNVSQIGIFGDMVWDCTVVSASVGLTSPDSLVTFDTFHCFLSIDGAYTLSTTNGASKITINNPDLFDGPTALCLDHTTAIGVRDGSRYKLYFDDGNGTGVPVGHPTRGVWFDFDKLDADGLPTVGTISGMQVAGVAALRGPNDSGSYAWADASTDRVGYFAGTINGIPQYSDFGLPITVSCQFKADMFADIWSEEAPEDLKVVDSVHMLMSFPIYQANQQYAFNGVLTFDQLNALTSTGIPVTLPFNPGAVVGSAIVGSSVVGSIIGTPAYQHVPLWQQYSSSGFIIQYSFMETSIYPWTSLGFLLYVNRQRRVGKDS